MKTKNLSTIVDNTVVPHAAFIEAERQLQQYLDFSCENSEAQGLAIVGESGTGKTSVMKGFRRKYGLNRDESGLSGLILFATVPPQPTIKNLAGALLAGFDTDDWERGTEHQRSKRLRKLVNETGIRMVMIDEFQHFYDRDKKKMMYNVADWLKVLIDDTHAVLVVAGLPACTSVISQNEQLCRRFSAPIQLPRFSWQDKEQRKQFRGILRDFNGRLSQKYELIPFHEEAMAFRFYCATGGLIGYLAKLLQKAERNAIEGNQTSITLEDLHVAHMQSIYSTDPNHRLKPFEGNFALVPDMTTLDRVAGIGSVVDIEEKPTPRGSRKPKKESLDAIMVTR